jgi:microcystin-dependent protein
MLDGKTVTRQDLIEAFSDGKTPDGKDFESLINVMVMQSASETAFDDKTMGMLTANEYQTLKGMQNNKFVTPLLLSKAFKGLLDPQFEDLRAKDSALEAQDAQLARVDAALQAQLDAKFLQLQNTLTGNMNTLYTRMLPIGSVIMWGLDLSLKPDNFEVCDGKKTFMYQGKSYTVPDLQGRFALGVGGSYGFTAKFGADKIALKDENIPDHQHWGSTSENGNHNHNAYVPNSSNGYAATYNGKNEVWRTSVDGLKETWHSGNHSHSLETKLGHVSNRCKGKEFSIMPPYFALHYLIKIAN